MKIFLINTTSAAACCVALGLFANAIPTVTAWVDCPGVSIDECFNSASTKEICATDGKRFETFYNGCWLDKVKEGCPKEWGKFEFYHQNKCNGLEPMGNTTSSTSVLVNVFINFFLYLFIHIRG